MLGSLEEKMDSVVKQWNGIKQTNTTTKSDKEWKKNQSQ